MSCTDFATPDIVKSRPTLSPRRSIAYTEWSKKYATHHVFVITAWKYWPTFKILSLAHSTENLPFSDYYSNHSLAGVMLAPATKMSCLGMFDLEWSWNRSNQRVEPLLAHSDCWDCSSSAEPIVNAVLSCSVQFRRLICKLIVSFGYIWFSIAV